MVTTAGNGPWRRRRDELAARDPGELSARELDLLADAEFWTDDPDRSIDVRREAYRAYCGLDDHAGAAGAAWRLFFDHFLVGEHALADGWLERCRRHVDRLDDPEWRGWLALADSYPAAASGDAERSSTLARAAGRLARGADNSDLLAMALQAEGCALISLGDRRTGLQRLDEAMIGVVNDELQPLFVGWVYCNVVSTCYAIADIRRATEWSSAAMRWCSTLQDGRMYPGLCRVYAAELASLRGDWDRAIADARRACDDLTAFDPRYAAAAFCLVGDLERRRGDLTAAAAAYRRAHELGALPQPGLALVEAAHGDRTGAIRSLRGALSPGPTQPLPRAYLLTALGETGFAAGDGAALTDAARDLRTLAESVASAVITAFADALDGLVDLDRDRPERAVERLRTSVDTLSDLGFPYETARRRLDLALAAERLGDASTAELERATARATFAELGARLDTGVDRTEPSVPTSPLTGRELDVLELVADGCTDGEVAAALMISHHTVARHMSNVRTKLGVPSRTAAVALGVERGWIQRT